MGINASMEIGKNGLHVFSSATAVISQNIANVSTPGYSRQKAVIETAPTTDLSGFTLGSGAMITNIDRFYDAFLQQQIVSAETTLGYDTTKTMVLQQIEPAFNEISTDGVGAAITNFFNSWQDLTNNPGGMAERQSVLSNAQILADDLHSTSKTLTDTIALQNASLTPVIDSINITLKDIGKLNGQITTTDTVSGNANEVRDKRDLLVKELAKQIGIIATENRDGTTDIQLIGSGEALVTGANAGTFSLDKTTDPNRFAVQLIAVGGTIPPKSVAISTGSLGAALDLRDTILPGYLAELDDLATTLATEVNTQHKQGYDLNKIAGIDFFTPPTNTKIGDLNGLDNIVRNVDVTGLRVGMQVTGAGIPAAPPKTFIGSITDKNDYPPTSSFTLVDANRVPVNVTPAPGAYTFTFPDASASAFFSINPAMTTDKIAASLNNSTAGDNLNAVAIAGLYSERLMSGGTLTFNGFWDALSGKVGLDVESSKTNVAQDEAFSNQLNILRDTTSGVSLDQELADLMKYQRSYQACAQVISTAAAMMDTVLGIVR